MHPLFRFGPHRARHDEVEAATKIETRDVGDYEIDVGKVELARHPTRSRDGGRIRVDSDNLRIRMQGGEEARHHSSTASKVECLAEIAHPGEDVQPRPGVGGRGVDGDPLTVGIAREHCDVIGVADTVRAAFEEITHLPRDIVTASQGQLGPELHRTGVSLDAAPGIEEVGRGGLHRPEHTVQRI